MASQQRPTSQHPPHHRRTKAPSELLDSTVQRLVDYFVVVSSKPRWDTAKATSKEKEKEASSRRRRLRRRRSNHSHSHSLRSSSSVESRQDSQDDSNSTPDDLPRNAGTEGNIHMPYHGHKAAADHTFQPQITARYPLTDYTDNPLNPMMLQFCFPAGDVITPVRTYQLPAVHYFVLTNDRGRKVYGTCFTVYEEYDPGNSSSVWKTRSRTTAEHDNDNMSVELRVDRTTKTLYLPKVLVLVSTWPYLTAFREYLAQLYRLATATNIMTAPIERFVVNLCREIPAPPPGAYEVQVPLLNSTIRFWAPPAKLPIAYVALPYKILFECLDCPHILQVWSAMICERKILLVSSQYSILTVCAEILCSLLFPMRWSHLYVPLLPQMLCPMLDAPVPYLVGIARDNWNHAQQYLSHDCVVVDLDRNSVQISPTVPPLPPLPVKKFAKLQTCLTETVGNVFWSAHGLEKEYEAHLAQQQRHHNYPHLRSNNNGKAQRLSLNRLRQAKPSTQWNERLGGLDNAFNLAYTPDSPNLLSDTLPADEQERWARVQEAFHQFFVGTLKEYRKFLTTVPEQHQHQHASAANAGAEQAVPQQQQQQQQPTFDRDGFLAHAKQENVPFLTELCMSQQFDDFIARRLYSPGEPDLVFFDQSIDAKKNRSKLKFRKVDTPFLQSASAHKDLVKFQAVPPNDTGLTEFLFQKEQQRQRGGGASFYYKKWPDTFDEVLFSYPRPIPKMITAEFDRQASMVSSMRRAAAMAQDPQHQLHHHYEDDDIVELRGGDYDPSPEVASFTVFFFVYSPLIGREWRLLQQQRGGPDQMATRGAFGSSRDPMVAKNSSEESVEVVMAEDQQQTAADACIADLSFGVCGHCPGMCGVQSTLVYMKRGAEDSFGTIASTVTNCSAGFAGGGGARGDETTDKYEPDDAYEEAREVAYAQLDLAFQTLSTMSMRGISADSESYVSLMEACGRFGDTKYAIRLMELMKKDGFVADSEVLASFVAAFATVSDEGIEVGNELSPRTYKGGLAARHDHHQIHRHGQDAYSKFLGKQLDSAEKSEETAMGGLFGLPALSSPLLNRDLGPVDEYMDESDTSSVSTCSTSSTPTGGEAFLQWFHYHRNRPDQLQRHGRRRRRKKFKDESTLPVTEMLSRQLALGESVLDFVYPDLSMDTNSDSCPHCSFVMSETDVVGGWTPCAFDDYSTQCPQCQHRFVPQFIVSTSAEDFEGSQGPLTPLYCEFLSPWVLRKELQSVVKGDTGIEGMLKPKWRQGTDVSATLFWNLMVLCRRYRLPFTFLLQGSFPNRLILPRKPHEM